MEAAKSAINKFTSNRGHHTTVEETVNPAVTRETVTPHRHEEATQAVDREVHQHHHHTTVQPLTHQEKLAEKHTHNVLPTEHREFRHDNEDETKQRLAADLGHFKDSSRVEQTHHTQAAAPTVTGEHVHHHVHETVVPVVHKETIQPEVVHTTVPVHETHHAAAQHHGLSALPMKTLDEFKHGGGVLTGGTHGSREEYDGQPRKYNEKLSTTLEKLGFDGHQGSGTGTTTHSHHNQTDSGVGGVGGNVNSRETGAGGLNSRTTGTDNLGSSQTHHGTGAGGLGGQHNINDSRSGTTGTGAGGLGGQHDFNESRTGTTGTGVGGLDSKHQTNERHSGTTGTDSSTTGTGKKPSLLDRLNPRVDADGDGKAGLGD